jgi:uncharacterized protein DUF6065
VPTGAHNAAGGTLRARQPTSGHSYSRSSHRVVGRTFPQLFTSQSEEHREPTSWRVSHSDRLPGERLAQQRYHGIVSSSSTEPGHDGEAADGSAEGLYLKALALRGHQRVPIVPAPRSRPWISGNFAKSAKRCLPLMVANENGWLLLNAASFQVSWNGDEKKGCLAIEYEAAPPWPPIVDDSFGNGVISFLVPYLFRTPPGWNLLARGPSNSPKDGISPLEGLIETDWAVATFTMNWKITRPDFAVTFNKDEPFCMVVPQHRHELSGFRPVLERIQADPATARALNEWGTQRRAQKVGAFLQANGKQAIDAQAPDELLYFRGLYPGGLAAPDHQIRLALEEFAVHEHDGRPSEGSASDA